MHRIKAQEGVPRHLRAEEREKKNGPRKDKIGSTTIP